MKITTYKTINGIDWVLTATDVGHQRPGYWQWRCQARVEYTTPVQFTSFGDTPGEATDHLTSKIRKAIPR